MERAYHPPSCAAAGGRERGDERDRGDGALRSGYAAGGQPRAGTAATGRVDADYGAGAGDGQPVVSGSQRRYRAGGAAGDAAIERVERRDPGGVSGELPVFKTGAVAHYPADRVQKFSTQAFRFLDGSEQRFPGFPGVLQRGRSGWICGRKRDENLREFFLSQGGRRGFSFTDPSTGTVYSNCSFASDTLSLEFKGPPKGETQVVVKENR